MQWESNVAQVYFNGVAQGWDSRTKAEPAALMSLVELVKPKVGSRILDIACGTGIMLGPLLQTAPTLLRGIDISPKMAHIAREKFSAHTEVQVTAEDFYTFQENGFHLAVLYNAYPHFCDKARLGKQLWRCLAPGGRFVIAHTPGRERINACHLEKAQHVSTELLPCKQEAERLQVGFSFDLMLDQEDIYLISGVKKGG